MRRPTPTDWTVGLLAVALAASGVAAVVGGAADDGPVASTATTSSTSPPQRTIVEVPPAGHVLVTGLVARLSADAQVLPDIPAPFTIDVPERGVGEAELTGALVDGRRVTITWTTGRPLAIAPVAPTSGLGLTPGPGTIVELGSGSGRLLLDGPTHGFRAGTYRIDAPVAVSQGSLSRPQDVVTFTADDETLLTTTGRAFAALPSAALHLEGPGTTALEVSDGAESLRLVRPDGAETRLARLGTGPSAFVLDATPRPDGWSVRLVARGEPVL